MCNLIQPSDPVEEIRIVLEISDVYRDLRGRGVKLIHARPVDHISQLDRAEIPPRRLDDTSGVNQGPKKRFERYVTAATRQCHVSQDFMCFKSFAITHKRDPYDDKLTSWE